MILSDKAFKSRTFHLTYLLGSEMEHYPCVFQMKDKMQSIILWEIIMYIHSILYIAHEHFVRNFSAHQQDN
jgi:hypothetical protein